MTLYMNIFLISQQRNAGIQYVGRNCVSCNVKKTGAIFGA